MKEPLLTIIVPAYNMELFLEQCLSSLENQSMMNHKVIVVDDGSSDRTAEIGKAFAKRLPDLFSYVYKENGGLGSARNEGMKTVTTKYVTFLDSDDWQKPLFVERVTAAIHEQLFAPDVVITVPTCYDCVSNTHYDWMDAHLVRDIFHGSSFVTSATIDHRLNLLEVNACRLVLRMEFLEALDFQFPEKTKWEDVLPRFQIMHYAKRCIAVQDVGFFYRTNRIGQITDAVDSSRLEIMSVYKSLFQYADAHNFAPWEYAYILNMMLHFVYWSLDFTTPKVRKDFVEALHVFFKELPKEYIQHYLNHAYPSKKDKVFLKVMQSSLLCKIYVNPGLTEFLKKIFKKFVKM